MSVAIREMRREDAKAFLEVHHAAARSIAGKDYPLAVIEAWAPLPITDRHIERVISNPDEEYRLIAERDALVVGISSFVPKLAELRACYVAPSSSRRGVGSLLVREIELIAQTHGLKTLSLDVTITAEPFYAALGYSTWARGEHVLSDGQRMACVRMRKSLAPRN
jgi:putative acetyltransferase